MNEESIAARFSAFYLAHYPMVLRACRRRLPTLAAAEDSTSEVFRVAWTRYPEDGEPGIAWLYAIIRNVVGDEYRRNARQLLLNERVAESLVEETGEPHTPDLDLRRALLRLRESDRELLFMAYWEDLSGAELAEVLGITVQAVWVRLNRARLALRRELGVTGSARRSERKASDGRS